MDGAEGIVDVRSNRSKVAPDGAVVEGQVSKNIRDAAAARVIGVVAGDGGVADRQPPAVVDAPTAVARVWRTTIGSVIGHDALVNRHRPAGGIALIGVGANVIDASASAARAAHHIGV